MKRLHVPLSLMSRRPLRSVFRFVALPPELGGKHKCTIVCFLIDVPAQKLGDVQIYREREMLEEFFFKKKQEKLFWLPVLTSSLPVSALMWRLSERRRLSFRRICSAAIRAGINTRQFRSAEICKSVLRKFTCKSGFRKTREEARPGRKRKFYFKILYMYAQLRLLIEQKQTCPMSECFYFSRHSKVKIDS